MHPIVFLPVLIAVIIVIANISAQKGSIEILKDTDGKGLKADFKEWSASENCEISLNEGDVLHFEVLREEGEIELDLSGKNGSEPYSGNGVNLGYFTVTIQETDIYTLKIAGKNATGNITVKIEDE